MANPKKNPDWWAERQKRDREFRALLERRRRRDAELRAERNQRTSGETA
jgi:hypothetical protein